MELMDSTMAHQLPVQLEIIIVGAGIIGFAAAATLSRAGHAVTVSKSCRIYQQVLIRSRSSWKSLHSVEKSDSQLLLAQMVPKSWRY